MNYLSLVLIGFIGGLAMSIFFAKNRPSHPPGTHPLPLATKDDIEKIKMEIEEIKNLNREDNYDLAVAEEEFYDQKRKEGEV